MQSKSDSEAERMMEDAALLEKTKWRLNGLNKFQNWTMKIILNNLDAYTQDDAQNYIKSKLSPEMRNTVLEELLKNKRPKKIQSVFAMLNTRTKKLDVDFLMSYFPLNSTGLREFIEVLMMASMAAPNVRHLKMNTYHIAICLNSIELRNTCFGYLTSLMELRILELVGLIDNAMDLALLCRELPNLRVLSAPDTFLECTTMSEEDIRLSFGHLRLLHISFYMRAEIYKIWEVLPSLNIIYQNILPNGLILEDFLDDENVPRVRKYLNYEALIYGSNVCVDYSGIRYLEFSYDENTSDELKKTPNLPSTLEGLSLIMLYSQETIDAILLKYGANLRWLSLRGNGYQSVDLNCISDLCPKLEVLSLTSVQVARNATQQINFHHLKELFTERVDMLDGSLTALLSSCPNLRTLELKVKTCCLDDLQQVQYLIVEKRILGSLKSLDWGIFWMASGLVFKAIAAILKNASATLPVLRNMKLTVNHIRLNIDNFRTKSFTWSNYNNGLEEAIISDKNLFEILNLYE
ncbi:Hypothetical predicted protein [Cloeon dipterum]|uniref:F-box/LRR-repeat protein 15/At3g58940/PEG3-like LRR domain-containing protein n=1 Tax=Cloeon dipterum TaxID=197152 RepID=A0A8S1DRH9_9INSE|nr:Hypothetical predicted protein [Cloeon dipterum]